MGLRPSKILNLVQNSLRKTKEELHLRMAGRAILGTRDLWLNMHINQGKEKKQLKHLAQKSPKRLQIIGLWSTEHFFQKEICWINNIKFRMQMKQALLWGVKLEQLWGQQDRDTQMTFYIYQQGNKRTHGSDILCQCRRNYFTTLICVSCTQTYSI